jgi:hypothetical protein
LPGVPAVYARAVSRWSARSSRSRLTAAVSWRDCRSPRRAALPRREVRRAPASSRLSPAVAIAPAKPMTTAAIRTMSPRMIIMRHSQ